MNMREDEHNKGDFTSHPTPQFDWFAQLPTTPRPGLRRVMFLGIEHITEAATEPHKAMVADIENQIVPLRNLIKSSGIYALASVAAPLVSLVLAPFLTHHLSPSDFGILTILSSLISLTTGITQLGLYSAFFRAYGYDYTSKRDQRDVVATVIALLCLVTTPIVIGVAIMAPFLANLLFGRSSLGNLVALAGGVVLLQNLTIPAFAWLRAKTRALIYSILAVGNLLITLIANIILVGGLHLGIAGSLIGTGCGYASVVICTMPIIVVHAGIRIRADIVRSLLTFGLPLVLNYVSYWVLQLSDRYLLSFFGSLAQTATYAVAYNLGSVLSIVIVSPFTLAWPTAMFAIAKREDAAQVFRLVFRWLSMVLFFTAFGLSLVGTLVLNWFFPITYYSAAPVIPVVAESIVFYGIYYVFMVGANITRKTWLAAVFTTIAAIVNFTINLFLIPYFGAMGAAMSTLFAFVVLAVMAYIVNQRIYPVPFEIGIFITALLVGIALYIGSDFLAQSRTIYEAWFIRSCALVLYGASLTLLVKLPAHRP